MLLQAEEMNLYKANSGGICSSKQDRNSRGSKHLSGGACSSLHFWTEWQNQDHPCYLLSCSRMTLSHYLHRLFSFHSYRGKFFVWSRTWFEIPSHIPLSSSKLPLGGISSHFSLKRPDLTSFPVFSGATTHKLDKPTTKTHTPLPREGIEQ